MVISHDIAVYLNQWVAEGSNDLPSQAHDNNSSQGFTDEITKLCSLTSWPSQNYQLLSEYANTLSLSDASTQQLLCMVRLFFGNTNPSSNAYILIALQVLKFDKSLSFPETVSQLRNAEKKVFDNAALRSCTFEDIPVPFAAQSRLPMIVVTADLRCVTYDLLSVAQDLLNDGDHGEHAIYQFAEDTHPTSGIRQFGEMWTANWWRSQQLELHEDANILVPILYVDETPVTHNGRNMHPIYMSLGNLYVESRYALLNCTSYYSRFIQAKAFRKKTSWFYAHNRRGHKISRLSVG